MAKENKGQYEMIRVRKSIWKRMWNSLGEDDRQTFISDILCISLALLIVGGLTGLVLGEMVGSGIGETNQAKTSCTNLCNFYNYQSGNIIDDSCVCLHPQYTGGSEIYEIKGFR